VLLTEGNSTSAREAVTLLGRAGHHVEVCDPGLAGLARFSRHVKAWHRSPGLRDDPIGFRAFVLDLIKREPFDVLLPIHEQGYVLAPVRHEIAHHAGIALPSFDQYRVAHSKAGFSRLLSTLKLGQPPTRIVRNPFDLRAALHYPCVVKTAIGTANRGVWLVRSIADVAPMLAMLDGYDGDILIQDWADGALEKAQAVFAHGEMVGFHAFRQIKHGAGGGDAIKRSVLRPDVAEDLSHIGHALEWHGALSVDYILPEGGAPLYIDCNPRLVEPMSASLAGVDLMLALLTISMGSAPKVMCDSQPNVATHQALQVLLGAALDGGTRRDMLRLCQAMRCRSGVFAGSVEELTPWRDGDPMSAIPLAMATLVLLASPRLAGPLSRRGWGAHLMTEASAERVRAADHDPAGIAG
jgi:hypothetical protein